MLILVQPYPQSDCRLGNATFAVDVGFAGLLGPMRPILLADGSGPHEQRVPSSSKADDDSVKGGWVWGTFPPVRHRIVKGAHYSTSLGTLCQIYPGQSAR